MGFLSDVVARIRRDLERSPLDESRLMARAMATPPARDFEGALRGGTGLAVIAEIKRASPSAGPIAEADPRVLARAYEQGGATAVSVLTETHHFDGSLSDLRAARVSTRLPVLRKDFLVHPSQLMETRAGGADAALLITAALPGSELPAMLQAARDLGLASLVEAHSADDVERAVDSGATVVGINARDLESLEVDEDQALDLLGRIPEDRVRVLESGISTRAQVERAVAAGANAVLVGEALMRARNPAAKLRQLRGELASVGGGPAGEELDP